MFEIFCKAPSYIIMDVTPDGKTSGCRIGEVEKVYVPFVGMVFPSWDSVESYYRKYAKQEGFGDC